MATRAAAAERKLLYQARQQQFANDEGARQRVAESQGFVIALAYRFAMPLFSGLFRASGKPMLAHLIGVASVLVALRQPVLGSWTRTQNVPAVEPVNSFVASWK